MGIEYQSNVEVIRLEKYNNLLLHNTSYLISNKQPSYRFGYGLEIQESLFGDFGGLYVFGFSTDFDYKLNKLPISLNINTFIGGGGGSSAPDGSGLCYKYSFGIKAHVNKRLGALLRYSSLDFPSGEIAGNQFQLGFTYSIDSIFNNDIQDDYLFKQSLSLQSLLMNIDKNDASRLDGDYRAKLIGMEYSTSLNDRFNGLIRLQAAVSDKIDGFMSYYSGISYSILDYYPISLNVSALIGSCGGGSVQTSGGSSYLIESSLGYSWSNKTLSINRGKNSSFRGSFSGNYIQIGLTQNFESNIGLQKKNKPILSNELKESILSIIFGFENHGSIKYLDYNNRSYNQMGLMIFGVKYPYKSIYILSSTKWAFLGDYGAYAEATIGLSKQFFRHNNISFSIPIELVIAGGGGIDVGKGIGAQINLQIQYDAYKNLSLFCSLGKINMYKGNYDPLICNIGLSKDLSFLIR